MESRSSRELLLGVKELVSWLLEHWPTKKDEWDLEIYIRKINALVRQCGLGPVWKAAEAALVPCKFLPEAAELFELLPSLDNSEPKQWHDPDCPHCEGKGFKIVQVINSRTGRADSAAERCPCKPPHTPKRKLKAEPAAEAEAERETEERIRRLNEQMCQERPEYRTPGKLATATQPLDPKASWERRQELRVQAERIAAARRQKLEQKLEVSSEGETVQ
jgi:hypothetical protein